MSTAQLHELAPSLPRVPLTTGPTPLISMASGLWLKDDGLSGTLYGGNKVRKLEYLLGDALHHGYSRVLTIGAAGSNHALATSIYTASLGIGCDVLHFDQPPTEHVRHNLRAISRTPSRLTNVGSVVGLPRAITAARVSNACQPRHRQFYFVPGGGSSPVGALGYVNAALELADQLKGAGIRRPLTAWVAAGTAGTLAGIVVGLQLAGLHDATVVGVRVTDRVVCNPSVVRRLIAGTSHILRRAGVTLPPRRPQWHLDETQFGAGYGIETPAGARAAVHARAEGLNVEPTYTAKALAAALAASEQGVRLYWHTLNARALDCGDPSSAPSLPREYAHYFA
jgi:D-cysteine desulfhydrase